MRSLNIFGKLLIYQSIPLLLTFFSLGWVVYDHMRVALLQEQRQQSALHAQHLINAVEDRTRSIEQLLEGIVRAPSFQSFDKGADAALLRALFEHHGEVLTRVAFVDQHRRETYIYERDGLQQPAHGLSHDPLIAKAFAHPNRVWWGEADALQADHPVAHLALVETGPDGRFLGALHADVAIRSAIGGVLKLFTSPTMDSAVFLTPKHAILSSSNMTAPQYAAIQHWIGSGADRLGTHGTPTFTRLRRGAVDMFVTAMAMPREPWIVAIATPYDRFIAPANALLLRIGLIAAVVLLAAAGAAWVAARRMAQPLAQLGTAARRLTEGDYDVAVDIKSNDEVGTLARSFNEMSASLREAHGALAREAEERRRAETALAATEARFQAFFEHSPICLNLKDVDGRHLLINKPYEEWLELPASQVLGRTLEEILPYAGVEGESLSALEQEVIRTGKAAERETQVLRHGRLHHRLLIKFPVTDKDGKAFGVGTAALDITERKEAEEAIRHNEERFRDAIDKLANGVAYFDADDRLAAANTEWLKLHAKVKEPIGRTYEELLRGLVAKGLLDNEIGDGDAEAWLTTRIASHRQATGEAILRQYNDGTSVLIRENRTPDGGIVQTRTDVTALRTAERKLAESDARFKALFDNLPLGLVVKDLDQRLLMINPNFERRWQKKEEDFLGKPYSSLFPNDIDGAQVAEEERQAFEEGRVITQEYQRTMPNGARRTVLVHKFPIPGEDGKIAAIGSAGVDITDLRQAQREASRAERLLYDAINSLPVAFALFDADDRLVLANDFAKHNTAWDPALIVPGTTYEELVRDAAANGRILNAIDDPEAWISERLARHRTGEGGTENHFPDGRVIYAMERKTSDGGIIALRLDITDRIRAEDALKQHLQELERVVEDRTRHLSQEIAERRQAERSLRELNENLEERVEQRTQELQREKVRAELASRAKTDFLQHMSHELRTPLNAVIGFSDMIRQEIVGPVGDERYRSYAADIYESGSYLLSLINDILDIGRIEEGVLGLDDDVIDLAGLIVGCRKVVEGRALEKKLDIHTEIPAGIPRLRGDERRIKQILINLLFNAIKFTPEGGRVTVKVCVNEQGELALCVIDTGIGIAREDIERVMEPFGRVENSLSASTHGTGLGLPICRALIEAHDGRIVLESVQGAGTRVCAMFPAGRVISADATGGAKTRSEG